MDPHPLSAEGLQAPLRLLCPPASPLRNPGTDTRPRYVPGPLAEGMVRVVLSPGGYEEPAGFSAYTGERFIEPRRVFDVPAEQYERWRAAAAAFDAMQEDIEATISARAQPPA
jgi:hypothetical protein